MGDSSLRMLPNRRAGAHVRVAEAVIRRWLTTQGSRPICFSC